MFGFNSFLTLTARGVGFFIDSQEYVNDEIFYRLGVPVIWCICRVSWMFGKTSTLEIFDIAQSTGTHTFILNINVVVFTFSIMQFFNVLVLSFSGYKKIHQLIPVHQ